jgi:hypothetical protein
MNPNQIPQNPLREFDELYVKDDKVLPADSELIANQWFKERDDENFKKELELLTVELQLLDEGKFLDPTHPSLPIHPPSHTRDRENSTKDNISPSTKLESDIRIHG